MTQTAFNYPSLIWLFPVAFVGFLIAMGIFRRVDAALFFAGTAALIAGFVQSEFLKPHIEKWLEDQRVYAILFRDFPKDKNQFIGEYVDAWHSGGEIGMQQKQEEMKIIMAEHRLKHYIANAPSDAVRRYIVAETWLLSTLYTKNRALCSQYYANSSNFATVWNAVGSKIYMPALDYTPIMIVGAVDSPETTTDADRLKAIALYAKLMQGLAASGALQASRDPGMLCNLLYREYYALSQMPPQDSVLVVKFLLSEDHLKGSPQQDIGGFLQKLNPFH